MGARGPKSAAQLSVAPTPTAPPPVSTDRPPAPSHLSKATAAWFDAVVSEYELESHHLRLLQSACEAWDRMQQARSAIAEYGLIFNDKDGNPKTRPEVAIERDSRIGFARLLRELDLDTSGPSEARRPPSLLSNRR
jgi:P27 family predicted phage terminase small subunit